MLEHQNLSLPVGTWLCKASACHKGMPEAAGGGFRCSFWERNSYIDVLASSQM